MEISGYVKGLDQQRRKEYIEKVARIAAKDPYLLRCTEQYSETECLERQEREDEEFIKSVNFKNKSVEGKKIVVEEIIEDVESIKTDEPVEKKAPPAKAEDTPGTSTSTKTPGGLSLLSAYCQQLRKLE